MLYNRSSSKEKWTMMMYMRNFKLMVAYAYALRESNALSTQNIDDILLEMENAGIYHPRSGGSTFTGQFKSIQIAWYMFGYYNKSRKKGEAKKMVFSPLGNLLLDNFHDEEKRSRIFLTMLFANGFHQPFSKMDERFNIYAYRLVFQLLREPRLEGKLYADEAFYYAMFLKTVDETSYEELVSDIIAFRKQSPHEKLRLFKKNEHVVGLACHEWRYTSGMLESAGVVSVCNDYGHRVIGRLSYGRVNALTGRASAVRSYTEDYITLAPSLIPYVDKLLSRYSFCAQPYPQDEISKKFNSAVVVEIYSFYPPELLEELGMDTQADKAIVTMLNIASDVDFYSRKETTGGENFEYALADAMNLFMDVEAERIGGAGNSDIECVYFPQSCPARKFDVEAKATARKLMQVNARRLKTHRVKIGSRYTIIVAPSYAAGVLRDIEGEKSVIIKAATLANYLYQYILKSGRNISYAFLDELIEGHMGLDITAGVNAYVYSNFGHEARDF